MARRPSNAARRARTVRQPRAAELLFLKVIAKRMALFNAAVEEIIFPIIEDIAASEERFITSPREDARDPIFLSFASINIHLNASNPASKRLQAAARKLAAGDKRQERILKSAAKSRAFWLDILAKKERLELANPGSTLFVTKKSKAAAIKKAAATAASATAAKVPLPQFVTRKLETLELRILQIFDPAEISKDLNVIGKRIAKKGGKQFQEVIGRVAGIDIRSGGIGSLVDEFRDKNVARITSLAGKELTEITSILSDAETPGLRVEVIRDQIRERFNVSKSRASLIARDQVLTLNANVAKQRQTNAGIEEYTWTTSGDDRVRDEHAERDGQRFRWDTPPEDGHPGEPIQCRCTAFPVLPELAPLRP